MFKECKGMVYTIKTDDTLYKISKRYNISVKSLMRANPYVDVYNLQIGDEICIPVKDKAISEPIVPKYMEEVKMPEVMPIQSSKTEKTRPYVIMINCTLAQILNELKVTHEELVRYNVSLPETFMPGMVVNVPVE